MKLTHPLRTAVVWIAVSAGFSMAASSHAPLPSDPGYGTRAVQPSPPEPPVALVRLGDKAPDISWEAEGGRWLHLHDLLAQGPVLLVFAPDLAQMKALAADAEGLARLGVVPAVVLDRRSGAARSLARKAGLTCTVIPDVHRVVATQFNVLRRNTLSAAPGWFVIDRQGTVRDLARGSLAVSSWTRAAATALALPHSGEPLPAGSH